MIRQWLHSVFGPSSRFEAGDSVQPAQGERELMVVTEVVWERGSPEPQLLCQWFDSVTNEKREHLFRESELTPFDWNRPMQRPLVTGFRPTPPTAPLDAGSVRPKTNRQSLTMAGIDVQLGLDRLNGNQDVYEKLLRKFSDGHQHFVSELKTRTAKDEWTEAQRMTHTLKGLSGTLGMTNLQLISHDVESSVKERDVDNLRQKLDRLSDELERILKAIRENVQQQIPSQPVQSSTNIHRTLQDLEQSLNSHNPQALNQISQLTAIKGHEDEIEALGQAIALYQFDKALTVLRGISGDLRDQGESTEG